MAAIRDSRRDGRRDHRGTGLGRRAARGHSFWPLAGSGACRRRGRRRCGTDRADAVSEFGLDPGQHGIVAPRRRSRGRLASLFVEDRRRVLAPRPAGVPADPSAGDRPAGQKKDGASDPVVYGERAQINLIRAAAWPRAQTQSRRADRSDPEREALKLVMERDDVSRRRCAADGSSLLPGSAVHAH